MSTCVRCDHPARFRVQYTWEDLTVNEIVHADTPICGRHLAGEIRLGEAWSDPDPVCVVTA